MKQLREHLVQESRHQHERGPHAVRAEIKASGDFHLMLASLAGNAILEKFMDELVARSSLVIALYGRSGVQAAATTIMPTCSMHWRRRMRQRPVP